MPKRTNIGTLEPVGGDPEHGLLWHVHKGAGPVVGLAVHAGHEMRPDLWPYLAIDEEQRYREEDPYTDFLTLCCDTQFITRRSRFEVDLNRTEMDAICIQPEDCWNLKIWKNYPPESVFERSHEELRAFYEELEILLKRVEKESGHFVVLDFHSYNHRRNGPTEPPEDKSLNPQINIGTGSMDRERWGPLVDRFINDLRQYPFPGGKLDVRENVKFKGREVPKFIHQRFPETGCSLAIEVKKFFMDEWSGEVDEPALNALLDAFNSAVPGLKEELARQC